MPAVKGQKFKEYSYETKVEAIRLHLVEGWTYRRIMDKFRIEIPIVMAYPALQHEFLEFILYS